MTATPIKAVFGRGNMGGRMAADLIKTGHVVTGSESVPAARDRAAVKQPYDAGSGVTR